MAWTDYPFVAIDFETTGLDPTKDRVIEFGWAFFVRGKLSASSSRLCKVDVPLSAKTIEITKITEDMLKKQPCIGLQISTLLNVISKATFVVTYSGTAFDQKFLEAECARLKVLIPKRYWIDACIWVREHDKYQSGSGRHRLDVTAKRWGVSVKESHRAQADAETAGALFCEMAKQPFLSKIKTVLEVVSREAVLAKAQEISYANFLISVKQRAPTITSTNTNIIV